MAVYTQVSGAQAADVCAALQLGDFVSLEPISGGIENTNYFLHTRKDGRDTEHVLTLFERLSAAQLPFYLHLKRHLAAQGVAVPAPVVQPFVAETGSKASKNAAQIVFEVAGKPAAVVSKLRGKSQLQPQAVHCAAVGQALARMHLAGQTFELEQPNLRGLAWWRDTVPVVLPFVSAAQAARLQAELAYQIHTAQSADYAALPRGPIHADLFRDNVMFEGVVLTGFFDFYFAGCDTWLFDLAVCLNDWCIDHASGADAPELRTAFVNAYQSVRPLTAAERRLLPAMLRAGALRFWLSRLWDYYLPREASLLKAHDPAHFERVLLQRLNFLPYL